MGNRDAKQTVSSELTAEQTAKLVANTKYSEPDIQKWHQNFLHDCPSGELDKKTFVQVYKKFYPYGKVDAFSKRAFAKFDINNDGIIDFSEFLMAISAMNHGGIDERLQVAFDMFDLSKDGEIDQKELADLLSSIYDLIGETDRTGSRDPNERAAHIISQLDINGNRMLNREEFINGCKNDPIMCAMLAPNL